MFVLGAGQPQELQRGARSRVLSFGSLNLEPFRAVSLVEMDPPTGSFFAPGNGCYCTHCPIGRRGMLQAAADPLTASVEVDEDGAFVHEAECTRATWLEASPSAAGTSVAFLAGQEPR